VIYAPIKAFEGTYLALKVTHGRHPYPVVQDFAHSRVVAVAVDVLERALGYSIALFHNNRMNETTELKVRTRITLIYRETRND